MTLIVGAKSVEPSVLGLEAGDGVPQPQRLREQRQDGEAARPDVDDRPDGRVDQDVTRCVPSRADTGRELQHGVRREVDTVQGLRTSQGGRRIGRHDGIREHARVGAGRPPAPPRPRRPARGWRRRGPRRIVGRDEGHGPEEGNADLRRARPSRRVAGQAGDGRQGRHDEAEHEHQPEREPDRVDQGVEEAAGDAGRHRRVDRRHEVLTAHRHGHGHHDHDGGQADAEPDEGGLPARGDHDRADGSHQGDDAQDPDQVVEAADGLARSLQLGQPWTVGQDDLAIDAAQVEAAGDVEALVDEAGLQGARASPRSRVSWPSLSSSASRSPVSRRTTTS